MRKWFPALVAICALASSPASAGSITFTLDCQFFGSVCTPGGPFGTVTATDSGDSVSFVADMNTGYFPFVVSLNTTVSGITGWSVVGGTLTVSPNNTGYNNWFDVRSEGATPYADPFSFTLSKTSVNLDPSDFLVKDENGLYYTAVRTTGPPGTTEGLFYGSTTVPDAASTLVLLGVALAGLASARRHLRP